jgi:hypothetical protein
MHHSLDMSNETITVNLKWLDDDFSGADRPVKSLTAAKRLGTSLIKGTRGWVHESLCAEIKIDGKIVGWRAVNRCDLTPWIATPHGRDRNLTI